MSNFYESTAGMYRYYNYFGIISDRFFPFIAVMTAPMR